MINQNFVQVFDSSSKEIETKSSVPGQFKTVLPLPHYNIFIAFADGHWLLFDYIKNKLINESVVEGDPSKFLTLIKAPKALDEENIVYVNCSAFKLRCLNPKTGQSQAQWDFNVPTEEALPIEDRSDDSKVSKAYASLEIEVLTKSRIVGVLEKKENNEYLVTAFKEGESKRLVQLSRDSGGKILKLRNGNKENTFILYKVSQSDTIQLLVLDINDAESGLKSVDLNAPFSCTIVNLFPWKDNSIIIFGNSTNGSPVQVIHKLSSEDEDATTFEEINCSYLGGKTIVTSVLHADEGKDRVILKETGFGDCAINVWNTYLKQNEFARKQEKSRDCVASTDGSYFIEFERNVRVKTNKVGLTFSRLVTKKMLLLFVMKYAQIHNKSFMAVHGRVDILIDVARMLAQEY